MATESSSSFLLLCQHARYTVLLFLLAQKQKYLYEFFKSQGANVVNDATDFAGTNRCYLFQGQGESQNKKVSLKDKILVMASHEGLVSSELWLQCRKKLLSNMTFLSGQKVKTHGFQGKSNAGGVELRLCSLNLQSKCTISVAANALIIEVVMVAHVAC